MKKTYTSYDGRTGVTSHRNDGSEGYALYVGIDAVYGGWILETGGDPCTLNDLEDAVADGNDAAEADINAINEIIAHPDTTWEDLDDDDLEYIQEWLEIWGLK